MNKILYSRYISVVHILLVMFLFSSCSKKTPNTYYLIVGESSNQIELSTALDLQKDLEKVVSGEVIIQSEKEPLPEDGVLIILGTIQTNKILAETVKTNGLKLSSTYPGSRGGIWANVELVKGQKAIVLAGSDVQGMQYAVYDYSKEILGVDPLEYWTGKKPKNKDVVNLFGFQDRSITPPKVPILCYFENDVDELANYRGKLLEYDWESYTELINSLVRLRYNAIQFFDMLGRPEYFIRPEYKKLNPDYQVDIDYVDKMINYAHEKGMKVSVDFALGYQIHPMSEDKATCWRDYKEDWLKAWRYYLEETPLKKTDIFILRPRHQVWDWEYKSTCGENKIDVFNEVYAVFGDLVEEYNPNAEKVLVCYSDGMQMWNDGLRPPKDWIVAWSDHGFGEFQHLPNTTDDYKFGTYMHAGYWLNHTVHNPYPEKIEKVMKDMFKKYKADNYCLVNGQNFRPFLLNIEAYSEVCRNPETFNSADFYRQWSERYFGKALAENAISSMKLLHQAQEGRIGYVQHLWEIREAIAYLTDSPIKRPGKTPVAYSFERVENDIEHVLFTEQKIDSALAIAKQGLGHIDTGEFYHSYVYLPALLFSDLIAFERDLHKMCLLKKKYETAVDVILIEEALRTLNNAKKNLAIVYDNRIKGDKNQKWNQWYDPSIRRPNNGFPTMEMIHQISENLNLITKK